MFHRFLLAVSVILMAGTAIVGSAFARTPAPLDAEVFFISPKDGDVVTSPVTFRFGIKGMKVAPAGTMRKNSGHHHLLIDVKHPSFDKPVKKDAQHRHFGKGQTEATIKLSSGKHSLQLLLGDHKHTPHDPAVRSSKIIITVK